MQVAKLDTGFNIEIDFAICPFHKRMIAWCLDVLVLIAYSWLCGFLIRKTFGPPGRFSDLVYVLIGIPLLLYHLLMEVFFDGQSLGKKAMGIKVISAGGGQPSLSQYLIRWVFRIVDFPVWILPAIIQGQLPWWCTPLIFGGIASVIFSEKSQRLGDLVAGTMVIDVRDRSSWEDTVFTELDASYQPQFPQVMQLSDKDINALKAIIVSVRKTHQSDLSMSAANRIKSRLKIDSDISSIDFLETLLKDYNYYTSEKS